MIQKMNIYLLNTTFVVYANAIINYIYFINYNMSPSDDFIFMTSLYSHVKAHYHFHGRYLASMNLTSVRNPRLNASWIPKDEYM